MLFLMIFILSLSFINMMFISGVLSGLWKREVQIIIDILSADITVGPQQYPEVKEYISNQKELRAKIKTIPGITATARHYTLAGSISFDKIKNGQFKSVSGAIVGIDPIEEKQVLKLDEMMMMYGESLSETDTDQIVFSSALAGGYGTPSVNDLGGVKVGDKVQITYSNGIMRIYTVKGIYNDIMGIYETFITTKEAESVASVYNSASQILVKSDLTKNSLEYYQNKIKKIVPNLKIQNYNDLLGSFVSFERALSLISDIVSVISVIVAAVTIFVLIYVNAINRRRQIGILRAIGLKEKIIVNAYVIQSLFYTFCGLITGSLAVFGIIRPLFISHPIPIIEGLMNLELSYTPFGIFISVISFIVAGYLAGYVPSRIVVRQGIRLTIWG
ncbi:MAG: FtsX-like permease family protein [Candidatus Paceibacterota bacterium]